MIDYIWYESHSVGFERNQKAREECLKYYGCKCSVCGFDFEKEYGEIGRGFIEVHHIVPLSSIRDEYIVDPISDLRPLCSNCHSMVKAIKELGIDTPLLKILCILRPYTIIVSKILRMVKEKLFSKE